jgi:hypothetical protein
VFTWGSSFALEFVAILKSHFTPFCIIGIDFTYSNSKACIQCKVRKLTPISVATSRMWFLRTIPLQKK